MGLFRKEGGGGFLNGETAQLLSYEIEMKEWAREGDKKDHQLNVKLMIKRDDADAPVPQFLDGGFVYPDRGEGVSEDGLTLIGGAAISGRSEFGRFIQTLVEQRPEFEQEFSDADGNATNFEAMNGYRLTFGKEQNVEKQMAKGFKGLGIKKGTKPNAQGTYTGKGGKQFTEADIMQAGRRQDQNDKTRFYNEDRLIVNAVVGKEAAPAKGKAATKPATAPKATAAPPAAAPAKAANGASDYAEADKFLAGLVAEAKDSKLPLKSLNSVIVRKALEDSLDNATRDGYRTLLQDATYLAGWASRMGGAFDGKVISI